MSRDMMQVAVQLFSGAVIGAGAAWLAGIYWRWRRRPIYKLWTTPIVGAALEAELFFDPGQAVVAYYAAQIDSNRHVALMFPGGYGVQWNNPRFIRPD